ncbi:MULTISPECIES: sulfatase-like hydrolase/transferase [unclassified Haladaptatus]|uniref:sulfatase-like hydrolase/transferase n=1 Tax=unclassified Haladaptatus TaxID=2622732 RepID=UPI00209C194D|nr:MULTISPECIES: sulfatase-like hydrolase/transferase [unclassified Haladaptatus]MCO8246037.1 sulfatase-like hydrolase/transferase [Haladaptatus sp. AB643]MCO8254342.1 sulfatase-like hydrolase/transferase [Haladaptatus sp. AB618]
MSNIALVVLDTLRKDRFDDYFDWLPGHRFERAFSTSHWTVPAHTSMFTGKYASEVGVYANAESLDCEETVLAERLSENGYSTRAFSGNVNISKAFKYHRGFDEFIGSWRLKAMSENVFDWDGFIAETQHEGPQRYVKALYRCLVDDCDTISSLKRGALLKLRDIGIGEKTRDDGATAALDFVRKTNFHDQEFLFMNLVEAHTPYHPPAEFQTVEPPSLNGLFATLNGGPKDDPHRIKQGYSDASRYLSVMYEKIFEELQSHFDLIITVSDHGELLGEHNAWEHAFGVYPELTHVPFSIYDGSNGHVYDESVSLLDVHATILSEAGIDAPSRGRDLRNVVEDGEFISEYHGISDRHYESMAAHGFSDIDFLQEELSGLIDGSYYGYETPDGFQSYGSGTHERPQGRLKEVVESLNKRSAKQEKGIDDSVLRQLQDLGYA